MREADLILALGTRLGFNTTFFKYDNISRNAKIVQIDIEPSALGRYFPVAIGIVGDAGTIAGALADAMEPIAPEAAPWKARNHKFQENREQWRKNARRLAIIIPVLHELEWVN
jgi:thiamine pyrophosphate-dependent acetolactate synthase large subunit-like protein